jgi:hypothetical protein
MCHMRRYDVNLPYVYRYKCYDDYNLKIPQKIALCFGILQMLRSGTPPTRAMVYIDTHTQPGGKYPNDEVRARVV